MGYGMQHAIAQVNGNTSDAARGVRRENIRDRNLHGWDAHLLEHGLGHALAIHLGVQRRLGHAHWMIARSSVPHIADHREPVIY